MQLYQASDLVIFENSDIIVCHKPAGLAVQNARAGRMDLESILKNAQYEKTGNPYLGIIHRLDQPVEGLVVFAKTPDAARDLSLQIQQGKMKKEYLAVVHPEKPGLVRGKKILLEDYLLKDAGKNHSEVKKKETRGAKLARLTYEVLEEQKEEGASRALLHVCLDTGRHHQIRVQLSHAGLPIEGDQKYGGAAEIQKKNQTLALCAFRLKLRNPATKKEQEFRITPQNPAFSCFDILC